MDYEKAYKEAIERLKGLIEGTREDRCVITEEDIIDIFPELAESEDERIRKWLEETIEAMPDNSIDFRDVRRIDVLHWLEKQGEQKAVLDELEMTLSVSEDAYLRENIEKLIKELKGN